MSIKAWWERFKTNNRIGAQYASRPIDPAALEPVTSTAGRVYLCRWLTEQHHREEWARQRCPWCVPVSHDEFRAWQVLQPLREDLRRPGAVGRLVR